jgi:hypothetical protein
VQDFAAAAPTEEGKRFKVDPQRLLYSLQWLHNGTPPDFNLQLVRDSGSVVRVRRHRAARHALLPRPAAAQAAASGWRGLTRRSPARVGAQHE